MKPVNLLFIMLSGLFLIFVARASKAEDVDPKEIEVGAKVKDEKIVFTATVNLPRDLELEKKLGKDIAERKRLTTALRIAATEIQYRLKMLGTDDSEWLRDGEKATPKKANDTTPMKYGPEPEKVKVEAEGEKKPDKT